MVRILIPAAALLVALTGCSLIPDYLRPGLPVADRYPAGPAFSGAGAVSGRVAAGALGGRLKREPSRGGQPFPHLYGPLDPREVACAQPLELNAEGWPDPGALQA